MKKLLLDGVWLVLMGLALPLSIVGTGLYCAVNWVEKEIEKCK